MFLAMACGPRRQSPPARGDRTGRSFAEKAIHGPQRWVLVKRAVRGDGGVGGTRVRGVRFWCCLGVGHRQQVVHQLRTVVAPAWEAVTVPSPRSAERQIPLSIVGLAVFLRVVGVSAPPRPPAP